MLDFLWRAKRFAYARPDIYMAPSLPAVKDFQYAEGDLLYLHSQLGERQASLREVLWQQGQPLWALHGYARILSPVFSANFLQEALLKMELGNPLRGPLLFEKDGFRYVCSIEGDWQSFVGKEEVYKDETLCYQCTLHGGLLSMDAQKPALFVREREDE